MSPRPTLLGRARSAVLAAVGALALMLGLLTVAPPAVAQEAADVQPARVDGQTRFHTAANIATLTFTGADTAHIVTGEEFADALAASYAAGAVNGPVLLVTQHHVPGPTWSALDALGVERTVLIGGENAISSGVEAELAAAGYDTARVSGPDRYETAVALATTYGTGPGGQLGTFAGDRTAILASGAAFPDALSAGPLASAGNLPLLLTPPDTPHPSVTAALDGLGIERILVIGGQAAVSSEVVLFYEAQGYAVERFAGANRTETAVTVARNAIARAGFSPDGILLGRGDDYPDALTAAIHGAAIGAPILLTFTPGDLSPATDGYLRELCPQVDFVRALGGTAAVTEATLGEAVRVAGHCTAVELGSWSELPEAPNERINHSAVWDGANLHVWGGGDPDAVRADGIAYNVQLDEWFVIPEAPIDPRWGHEAVWADGQMIVYGGSEGPDHLALCYADGAAYNPTVNTWGEVPPGPHTGGCGTAMVWDGDEIIVWGGTAGDISPDSPPVNDGGRWHPSTGDWTAIAPNPIGARSGHAAVWTGHRMIVVGGYDADFEPRNEAAAYNPRTDEWTELPPAPLTPRFSPAVVWTGSEVIVVGGTVDGEPVSDGAAFDPDSGTWRTIADVPGEHAHPRADWSGELLLLVGGDRDGTQPGAVAYDPTDNTWTSMATLPGGHRVNHTVTWAGDRLLLFGGQENGTAGGHAWRP